jgi:hypothetical protein
MRAAPWKLADIHQMAGLLRLSFARIDNFGKIALASSNAKASPGRSDLGRENVITIIDGGSIF